MIGVAPLLRGSDVPDDVPGRSTLWKGKSDWMNQGYSAIVGPNGEILAGPLVKEEGILYAELDAAKARASRHQFDPVGHYSRPDVFQLTVRSQANPQVVDGDGASAPAPNAKAKRPATRERARG